MSETLLEIYPEDFRTIDAIGSGSMILRCMDDRHLEESYDPWSTPEAIEVMGTSQRFNRESSPQSDLQTAASIDGLSRDAFIALAIDKRGKLPVGAHAPDVIAQAYNRRARALKIVALRHKLCAADQVALKATENMADAVVANEIVNVPLWNNTQRINPEITEEQFILGALGARQLVDRKHLAPEDVAKRMMEADIHRVPLVEEPHTAGHLIADWNENRAFNTRDARNAGRPAYYANFARASRLAQELGDALPISESSFQVAMAMRHATLVTMHLPVPEDFDQLSIHRID